MSCGGFVKLAGVELKLNVCCCSMTRVSFANLTRVVGELNVCRSHFTRVLFANLTRLFSSSLTLQIFDNFLNYTSKLAIIYTEKMKYFEAEK